MDPITRSRLRVFARRVAVGAFAGGFAKGVTAVAVGWTGGLLVLRLFGHGLEAGPWLALALAVPLAWGLWAARVHGFSPRDSAAHLDRRLRLGGLLVTAVERGGAGPWRDDLHAGLDRARERRPRLRWRALAATPVLALAAAVGVSFLPPPDPAVPGRPDPVIEQQLADLESRLDGLLEEGGLDRPAAEELRERVEEMKERLAEGEAPTWSDLDTLEAQLAHERVQEAARAERALSDLASLVTGSSGEEGLDARAERLAGAVKVAADSGLLEGLPEELARELGLGSAGEDTAGLAGPVASFEDLQRLAAAAAECAGGQLEALESRGALDAGQLADLQAVLEAHGLCQGDGTGSSTGTGRPGRGGLTRGPGPAALAFENEGDLQAAEARRLPPGRRPSEQWERLGVTRAQPEVDPEAAATAGAPESGDAGRAAWQRRLAPRHRQVVREFFDREKR